MNLKKVFLFACVFCAPLSIFAQVPLHHTKKAAESSLLVEAVEKMYQQFEEKDRYTFSVDGKVVGSVFLEQYGDALKGIYEQSQRSLNAQGEQLQSFGIQAVTGYGKTNFFSLLVSNALALNRERQKKETVIITTNSLVTAKQIYKNLIGARGDEQIGSFRLEANQIRFISSHSESPAVLLKDIKDKKHPEVILMVTKGFASLYQKEGGFQKFIDENVAFFIIDEAHLAAGIGNTQDNQFLTAFKQTKKPFLSLTATDWIEYKPKPTSKTIGFSAWKKLMGMPNASQARPSLAYEINLLEAFERGFKNFVPQLDVLRVAIKDFGSFLKDRSTLKKQMVEFVASTNLRNNDANRAFMLRLNAAVQFIESNKTYNGQEYSPLQDGQAMMTVPSVKHAKYVANFLNEKYGEGFAVEVSGSTSAHKLKESIDGLESGKVKMLVYPEFLDTGVSIKSLRYVFVLNPKRKKYKLIQLLGRLVRAGKNKSSALCILFEFAGNFYQYSKYNSVSTETLFTQSPIAALSLKKGKGAVDVISAVGKAKSNQEITVGSFGAGIEALVTTESITSYHNDLEQSYSSRLVERVPFSSRGEEEIKEVMRERFKINSPESIIKRVVELLKQNYLYQNKKFSFKYELTSKSHNFHIIEQKNIDKVNTASKFVGLTQSKKELFVSRENLDYFVEHMIYNYLLEYEKKNVITQVFPFYKKIGFLNPIFSQSISLSFDKEKKPVLNELGTKIKERILTSLTRKVSSFEILGESYFLNRDFVFSLDLDQLDYKIFFRKKSFVEILRNYSFQQGDLTTYEDFVMSSLSEDYRPENFLEVKDKEKIKILHGLFFSALTMKEDFFTFQGKSFFIKGKSKDICFYKEGDSFKTLVSSKLWKVINNTSLESLNSDYQLIQQKEMQGRINQDYLSESELINYLRRDFYFFEKKWAEVFVYCLKRLFHLRITSSGKDSIYINSLGMSFNVSSLMDYLPDVYINYIAKNSKVLSASSFFFKRSFFKSKNLEFLIDVFFRNPQELQGLGWGEKTLSHYDGYLSSQYQKHKFKIENLLRASDRWNLRFIYKNNPQSFKYNFSKIVLRVFFKILEEEAKRKYENKSFAKEIRVNHKGKTERIQLIQRLSRVVRNADKPVFMYVPGGGEAYNFALNDAFYYLIVEVIDGDYHMARNFFNKDFIRSYLKSGVLEKYLDSGEISENEYLKAKEFVDFSYQLSHYNNFLPPDEDPQKSPEKSNFKNYYKNELAVSAMLKHLGIHEGHEYMFSKGSGFLFAVVLEYLKKEFIRAHKSKVKIHFWLGQKIDLTKAKPEMTFVFNNETHGSSDAFSVLDFYIRKDIVKKLKIEEVADFLKKIGPGVKDIITQYQESDFTEINKVKNGQVQLSEKNKNIISGGELLYSWNVWNNKDFWSDGERRYKEFVKLITPKSLVSQMKDIGSKEFKKPDPVNPEGRIEKQVHHGSYQNRHLAQKYGRLAKISSAIEKSEGRFEIKPFVRGNDYAQTQYNPMSNFAVNLYQYLHSIVRELGVKSDDIKLFVLVFEKILGEVIYQEIQRDSRPFLYLNIGGKEKKYPIHAMRPYRDYVKEYLAADGKPYPIYYLSRSNGLDKYIIRSFIFMPETIGERYPRVSLNAIYFFMKQYWPLYKKRVSGEVKSTELIDTKYKNNQKAIKINDSDVNEKTIIEKIDQFLMYLQDSTYFNFQLHVQMAQSKKSPPKNEKKSTPEAWLDISHRHVKAGYFPRGYRDQGQTNVERLFSFLNGFYKSNDERYDYGWCFFSVGYHENYAKLKGKVPSRFADYLQRVLQGLELEQDFKNSYDLTFFALVFERVLAEVIQEAYSKARGFPKKAYLSLQISGIPGKIDNIPIFAGGRQNFYITHKREVKPYGIYLVKNSRTHGVQALIAESVFINYAETQKRGFFITTNFITSFYKQYQDKFANYYSLKPKDDWGNSFSLRDKKDYRKESDLIKKKGSSALSETVKVFNDVHQSLTSSPHHVEKYNNKDLNTLFFNGKNLAKDSNTLEEAVGQENKKMLAAWKKSGKPFHLFIQEYGGGDGGDKVNFAAHFPSLGDRRRNQEAKTKSAKELNLSKTYLEFVNKLQRMEQEGVDLSKRVYDFYVELMHLQLIEQELFRWHKEEFPILTRPKVLAFFENKRQAMKKVYLLFNFEQLLPHVESFSSEREYLGRFIEASTVYMVKAKAFKKFMLALVMKDIMHLITSENITLEQVLINMHSYPSEFFRYATFSYGASIGSNFTHILQKHFQSKLFNDQVFLESLETLLHQNKMKKGMSFAHKMSAHFASFSRNWLYSQIPFIAGTMTNMLVWGYKNHEDITTPLSEIPEKTFFNELLKSFLSFAIPSYPFRYGLHLATTLLKTAAVKPGAPSVLKGMSSAATKARTLTVIEAFKLAVELYMSAHVLQVWERESLFLYDRDGFLDVLRETLEISEGSPERIHQKTATWQQNCIAKKGRGCVAENYLRGHAEAFSGLLYYYEQVHVMKESLDYTGRFLRDIKFMDMGYEYWKTAVFNDTSMATEHVIPLVGNDSYAYLPPRNYRKKRLQQYQEEEKKSGFSERDWEKYTDQAYNFSQVDKYYLQHQQQFIANHHKMQRKQAQDILLNLEGRGELYRSLNRLRRAINIYLNEMSDSFLMAGEYQGVDQIDFMKSLQEIFSAAPYDSERIEKIINESGNIAHEGYFRRAWKNWGAFTEGLIGLDWVKFSRYDMKTFLLVLGNTLGRLAGTYLEKKFEYGPHLNPDNLLDRQKAAQLDYIEKMTHTLSSYLAMYPGIIRGLEKTLKNKEAPQRVLKRLKEEQENEEGPESWIIPRTIHAPRRFSTSYYKTWGYRDDSQEKNNDLAALISVKKREENAELRARKKRVFSYGGNPEILPGFQFLERMIHYAQMNDQKNYMPMRDNAQRSNIVYPEGGEAADFILSLSLRFSEDIAYKIVTLVEVSEKEFTAYCALGHIEDCSMGYEEYLKQQRYFATVKYLMQMAGECFLREISPLECHKKTLDLAREATGENEEVVAFSSQFFQDDQVLFKQAQRIYMKALRSSSSVTHSEGYYYGVSPEEKLKQVDYGACLKEMGVHGIRPHSYEDLGADYARELNVTCATYRRYRDDIGLIIHNVEKVETEHFFRFYLQDHGDEKTITVIPKDIYLPFMIQLIDFLQDAFAEHQETAVR